MLEFTKMSGTGNDFIVIDNRFYHFSGEELSQMAKKLCPRRLGAGADGLLALGNPISKGSIFRMSYYNADGSLGSMCGNGARCLARYAHDAGLLGEVIAHEITSSVNLESGANEQLEPNKLRDQSYLFDSDAGMYSAVVRGNSAMVRLYVPAPQNFRRDVIVDYTDPSKAWKYHFIWTGTEHLVVQVEDVASVDVASIGNRLRFDTSLAPAGANVNFVQVQLDGSLKARTFEKGVESETFACGTGSIACALVSNLTGAIGLSPVVIHMAGGDLIVGWEGSAQAPHKLYLEGRVEVIYRATTEI